MKSFRTLENVVNECEKTMQNFNLSHRLFIQDNYQSNEYTLQFPFYTDPIMRKHPGWPLGRNHYFYQVKEPSCKLSRILSTFSDTMKLYFDLRLTKSKNLMETSKSVSIENINFKKYSMQCIQNIDKDYVLVENKFSSDDHNISDLVHMLKEKDKDDFWFHFTLVMIENKENVKEKIDCYNLSYKLQYKPAFVRACHLNLMPHINMPFFPFVDISNCSLENSEIKWYLYDHAMENQIHLKDEKNLFLYPKEEYYGKYLGFSILPKDSKNQIGRPYLMGENRNKLKIESLVNSDIIRHTHPVDYPPSQSLFYHRLKKFGDKENKNDIRFLSYNILAECYSTGKFAYDNMFPHCPLKFISINYRLPIILNEIKHLKADILCLQEVDISVFTQYLEPFCRQELNLAGKIMLKKNIIDDKVDTEQKKKEGPAIFYDSNRFELINDFSLPSIMEVIKQILNNNDETGSSYIHGETIFSVTKEELEIVSNLYSDWYSIADQMQMQSEQRTNIESKLHGASCVTLHLKEKTTGKNLLACSSHFYFHPLADNLRAIQAFSIYLHLKKLKKKHSIEGIVFGADMNSDPETPASHIIRYGETYRRNQKNQFLQSSYLDYLFSSNYFTHWVPGFSCILDYLMFNNSMKMVKNMPLISKVEMRDFILSMGEGFQQSTNPGQIRIMDPLDFFSLPNQEHPSDHLPISVDLRWTEDSGDG